MKVVIVGGVAGGATAAARLRRLNEEAEIVILERSGYVSYANCGLPYYIGGTIQDKGVLTLQTPESFQARFRIDVRVQNEVLSIQPEEHTVTVRRLGDGSEYTETYDKLILSPGARAIRPPLPGIDLEGIFTLRTVEDTFRIRTFLERERPRSAVVVGGGFIGLEMAENLIHAGVHTTMIQLDDQVLLPLDRDLAGEVHAYLRGQGLDLRLSTAVTGFRRRGGRLETLLGEREPVPADLVILAIGVAPGAEGLHLRGRPHADLPPGHLRRGGRGGAHPHRHRAEGPGGPGRAGQPPGAHRRRPHLRPGPELFRSPGLLHPQALWHDGGRHRPQRAGRPGRRSGL